MPLALHMTEKLRKKLHVESPQADSVAVPAHLRWYANVFTTRRRQYLITTNAASLYTVVWFGRGIGNASDFHRQFLHHLETQLVADDLRIIFECCIRPHASAVTMLKTADRSVVSSMSNMVQACAWRLASEEMSPRALSCDLNDMPYKALNFNSPCEVLPRLPIERVK